MDEKEALEVLKELSPWAAWVNQYPERAILVIALILVALIIFLHWLLHFEFFRKLSERLWN